MKKIMTFAILAISLMGAIFVSDMALAGDDDDDETEVGTRTCTIDTSTPTGVCIAPVSAKMFVMIFKTSSDYSGAAAEFQAQLEDGSWVMIGPGQSPGQTEINGMDSFGSDDFKLPLTVRVEVSDPPDAGTSLAQLDFVGGDSPVDDDDDDDT